MFLVMLRVYIYFCGVLRDLYFVLYDCMLLLCCIIYGKK